MSTRTFSFLDRLHCDESGASLVEKILLVLVAVILLIGIVIFATWALEYFNEKGEELRDETELLDDAQQDTPFG